LGQYRTRAALLVAFPLGKVFGGNGTLRYVKLFQTAETKQLNNWIVMEAVDPDFQNVTQITSFHRDGYSTYDNQLMPGLIRLQVANRKFRIGCSWNYPYSTFAYDSDRSYDQLPNDIQDYLKNLGFVWKNRKLSYTGKL
jgi:hypothetical protein